MSAEPVDPAIHPGTEVPVIDIDPFSDEALENPEPFQKALLEAGPFVWLSRYGVWASGHYRQVRAVLADWHTFCSSGGVGLTNFHRETPWREPSLVLEHDPPEHTRARAVMMRALSPAAVRGLRERFEREARVHVARLIEIGRFDAVTELAEGYPLKVFGDAVGITAAERRNLLTYGNMSFNALGPRNALFIDSMQEAEGVSAWIMAQCAREALDPRGLGAIMYAAADKGEVSEREATLLVRSFLSAGVDTTVRALGTALYRFALDPGQWQVLRADPGRARIAAEEALRFASPFQTVFRTTTTEFVEGPVRIAPDCKVLLSVAAANRDPRRWERPDEFDITRPATGQIAFGAGIHGCAGQVLARLEMEVILAELARQVAEIRLDGDIAYGLNNTVRGLSRLPLQMIA